MESQPADREVCRELLPHYEAIRRYVARRVACTHTVEELVQETYQRALLYGRDRTGSSKDRAWLHARA